MKNIELAKELNKVSEFFHKGRTPKFVINGSTYSLDKAYHRTDFGDEHETMVWIKIDPFFYKIAFIFMLTFFISFIASIFFSFRDGLVLSTIIMTGFTILSLILWGYVYHKKAIFYLDFNTEKPEILKELLLKAKEYINSFYH